MIEHLKWDTEFFGRRTGRVFANGLNLDEILEEAEKADYDTVYVLYDGMKPEAGLCESRGLYLSDIQIFVSLKFEKEKYRGKYFEKLNELEAYDFEDAMEIVRSTAVVSRFFNDSRYEKEKIREMYGYWLKNALNGTFSDGIFVERVNGRIGGVVIVKTDEKAALTLMGVNPEMKRHGLGRKLLEQVLSYWADMDREFDRIYSVFSMNNLESFRYHMKTGFTRIEDYRYVYHYTRNK